MPSIIDVNQIITLHDKAIIAWKQEQLLIENTDFLEIAINNHHFNYQLWQSEDKARRDDKGFEFVYQAKRAIDSFNQQRNNAMEKMDAWLFERLNPATFGLIHSETPGMIIDRLSILALKLYHMGIESHRQSATLKHQQICQKKLQVIAAQRQQLASCLEIFIQEIIDKTRTFKIYHQFKMYNDPALNPELYNQG